MTTYAGLQYSNTTTLAGLKQDIYFLGKCNSSSISDDDMNRIINKYYAQIQEIIRGVNENFYMVVATTDLIISDGSYYFPDGTSGTAPAYEKIKSIWAAYYPADISAPLTTDFTRADIIDPNSISQPAYTFNTDQPKALMFGDYFVLLPLVTDTSLYPVTRGVKIYYIATQDKLVNDTDKPKIFPSFHDAIVWGSLIDVNHRLGNTAARDEAKDMFKKRCEDIASYASAHIPDELGVIEGQDGIGGWVYPFGNSSMS